MLDIFEIKLFINHNHIVKYEIVHSVIILYILFSYITIFQLLFVES